MSELKAMEAEQELNKISKVECHSYCVLRDETVFFQELLDYKQNVESLIHQKDSAIQKQSETEKLLVSQVSSQRTFGLGYHRIPSLITLWAALDLFCAASRKKRLANSRQR